MKILLIQPPINDFYQTSIRTQPIGLAYLAASLKRENHEVEILDLQNGKKKSISIPPELSYLKEFYPLNDQSPFRLYTGFYHFGMGWDEARRRIEDSNADLYGISSSFTPYHGEALRIATLIKQWDSKKIVAMGGSHISCDPEGVLKSPFVDFIILGEGEVRFPSLIQRVEKGDFNGMTGMDGVGYRLGGRIAVNPLKNFIQDLDSLSYPTRDLLDMDRYRIHKKRYTMIITSRGCPHGCAYCSTHLVMGSSFRMRSPENILREMKECSKRYGVEVFDIEDDNFTLDLKRAKRLMELIIENFGEERLELSAMNGISFASLDRELLRLMKRAGFETVNLSLVSMNRSTKERMKRPAPATDFEKVLEETEAEGLNVIAYAILGIPGQRIEEMVETLIYLMERRVLIGPSLYYPTPGTPLFDQCKREHLLPSPPSQWRSSAVPIETEEFDRLDLVTLLRLVRIINFVKGKMDEREIEEGMSWNDLFLYLGDKVSTRGHKNDLRWKELIWMFLKEGAFFSLRKEQGREFSLLKERTSERVLNYFFDRAKGKPILRARCN